MAARTRTRDEARFVLRLPRDLYAQVTAQAIADRRSVNGEIIEILMREVDRKKGRRM